MALRKSLRACLIFAAVFLPWLSATGHCAETASPVKELLERVQSLEQKLGEIQKNQTTILEKQKELSEKLDSVKVWARHG